MEEKYRHTSIASPTEIEAIVGGVQVTFSVKDVNYFSVTTHMNNLVLIVLPKKTWVVLVGAIKQANSEETGPADQLPNAIFF